MRLEMLDAVEHSVVADNDLAFFVDAFSRVKLDVCLFPIYSELPY